MTCIALESGITVDETECHDPDPIIIRRDGQGFDLIVHLFYTLDRWDHPLGACLQGWS